MCACVPKRFSTSAVAAAASAFASVSVRLLHNSRNLFNFQN